MLRVTLAALALVAGCTGGEVECRAELDAWADADGDGFGSPAAPLGKVCTIDAGMSDVPLDCDDTREAVLPGAEERCDGLDNDCDGRRDEGHDLDLYYADRDGDGFGGIFESVLACKAPGAPFVANRRDCDDRDPGIHPDAQEVCGGGDEDCDGMPDDADASVDPQTYSTFYRDADGDGYGTRGVDVEACDLPIGGSDNADDCDDADPMVGRVWWYADLDGDGYGDPDADLDACSRPAGHVDNNLDCDDTDPAFNLLQEWYDDLDGDGYGGGPVLSISCRSPILGLVADETDCDDTDERYNPGVDDPCLDGVDWDCNGSDECQTCADWQETDPTLPTGTYTLTLDGRGYQVFCDMDTDGGGWTLVTNSNYYPPDDRAEVYYPDLDGLEAWNYMNRGVWDGLRSVIGGDSDIRFACGTPDAMPFDVDLSFYDIHWYRELTTGSDDESCFNEPGAYDQPAPARRNNVTGETRPRGDDWNAGSLRGEDSCSDPGDFAIDFDARGKQPGDYLGWGVGDPTSWGKADWIYRCGYQAYGQNFWIFVREP